MQPITNWFLVTAITTFSIGLSAAEVGYSEAYKSCMDETEGVTANMVDCIASEIQQQDARLNQNYSNAMNALAQAQQTQLRDAQRLWLRFRDADCALLGSLTGGTLDRINGASCLLDMTKKRADDLAQLSAQDL